MQTFKIHLPKPMLHAGTAEGPGFYGQLYRFLKGRGADVSLQLRETVTTATPYEAEAFHFVHQGQLRAANILNTSMSYFRPFWYADPRGVYAESSIGQKVFDPEAINAKWAMGFFTRMQRWFVEGDRSKHPQPHPPRNLGQGHVAVFLQGQNAELRRTAHMEEIEMVEALLAGLPEHRILVKTHPKSEDLLTTAQIMRLSKTYPRLKLVEANIHDMLRGACLSCSAGSSASMEGLLHRVPAMLFGRTDFHHCAVTVQSASDVAYALDAALSREWPYEAFLYWFLRQTCQDIRSEDWADNLLDRVQSMG